MRNPFPSRPWPASHEERQLRPPFPSISSSYRPVPAVFTTNFFQKLIQIWRGLGFTSIGKNKISIQLIKELKTNRKKKTLTASVLSVPAMSISSISLSLTLSNTKKVQRVERQWQNKVIPFIAWLRFYASSMYVPPTLPGTHGCACVPFSENIK